jgi:transposase
MKTTKLNKLDFTGQDIFAGIDVHKKNWSVCILTEEFEHKVMTIDPNPDILINYLKKHFPNANYHSAYEAGYSGFSAHEKLLSGGIQSIVINPADVPTTEKEKLNKSDKIDRRKIAENLRAKKLNGIYVPDIFYQEARALVRCRYQLMKDQTRVMNQIKSNLNFFGVQIPEVMANSNWSGKFIQWLKDCEFRTKYGTQCLQNHISHLMSIRTEMAKVTKQIRSLAKEKEFKKEIDLLMTIPGIGIITAIVFMTEIIDITRFKNLDDLVSFIGIAPRQHSSGEKHITGRMTKRGNRYLRYLLIEASWVAIRKDPSLTLYYTALIKNKLDKAKAIIKVTRKLLNRMRHVLKTGEQYVIGVV